ncbi:hypothetical protein MLD38_035980 [Melastoma candidum]|uniref:Uncharacterized protein n=1 Tax=Melastoma candidum TaxID=119954 RepID=A0ACB9LIX5_9MYRT|nr:hypothetical protein MLD38_035980 [Melastoma candidum]
MGRHSSCCHRQKLRKGLWSPEEDQKLARHITLYGHGCWSSVPKLAGRWSQIASQLPGRTDNEIKNLWNSSIKKKLIQRGIDPKTHKPLPRANIESNTITPVFSSSSDVTEKYSPTGFLSSTVNSSSSTPHQCTNIPTDPSPTRNLFPRQGNGTGSETAKLPRIFPFQEVNYGPTGTILFPPDSISGPWFPHQGYNPFSPSTSASEKWFFTTGTTGQRDARLHNHSTPESEDVKWSDYLNIPYLGQNHQEKQPTLPHNHGVASETKFIPSTYVSSFSFSSAEDVDVDGNNHELTPTQAADIYCKDIRRLAAAYGNS